MRTSCLLVASLVGCTAPATAPSSTRRGPHADEHLSAARDHHQRARELERWPDRRSTQDLDGELALTRWSRSWDSLAAHRHEARVHRSEAAALHAEFDEACRDLPLAKMAISPLQRYGVGGAPRENGVVLFLSPYAGSPDALLAELRCHRAYMMLGPITMDDCPLDLPGIQIGAHGDPTGITLELTVDDVALVPELQRRTALDLENANLRRDRAHE